MVLQPTGPVSSFCSNRRKNQEQGCSVQPLHYMWSSSSIPGDAVWRRRGSSDKHRSDMSEHSSSNDSLHHPQTSSINSSLSDLDCLFFQPFSSLFTSFTITSLLLLLPVCILILNHGVQRWQQQRSSTRSALTSHSDVVTYHVVTMDLISVFGNIFGCCSIYTNDLRMLMMWFHLFSFTVYEATFFHLLTCVEPYLAVVHPITYLSLKTERGVRIRNVCIGCIWLLCIIGSTRIPEEDLSMIFNFSLLIFSVIVISFCCLSVLRVLIRPGPGEQGRNRDRVDQSKQRAFYTIVVILGVLMLRFVWDLVWSVLYMVHLEISVCVWLSGQVWINLLSSVMSPLLFLHRAGKLGCCRTNIR